MAFLNWDDSLSVKIDSIDEEHKKLIGLINDFYQDIYTKSPREKIRETVKGLKDYTALHFSTEEKYMQKFDYPEYENHKQEHDHFVQRVLDYEERLNDGKFIVSIEITNFIKDWIQNHIKGTDQKYTEYFIERGIK